MLVVYPVVLPLPLTQDITKHEEAGQHEKEHSQDVVHHEVYHEDDDGCKQDATKQENHWMHKCNIMRMIHLEAIVKSLESWVPCFVQFSLKGNVQLCLGMLSLLVLFPYLALIVRPPLLTLLFIKFS